VNGRRRSQPPFTSPVLIGAVTVLVVIVAVFLAYNSNTGLPFVPTRVLRVDFSSGADLVAGDEVVDGGSDIGIVSSLRPVRVGGRVIVQATLKLHSNQRIPVDSSATILSRSVLGLKYVSITRGSSPRIIPNGGLLGLNHTSVPVQLDQIFDIFTPPVRSAVQRSLVGVGDVLAGRGPDLNETIRALPPLFGYLTPVARYLAAPSSRLVGFLRSLAGFAGTVAPVSGRLVALLGDGARTFAAISASPSALESSLARAPATLSVGTRSLAVQRPFLGDLNRLGEELSPGVASLRGALPQVDPAIEQASRVLGRTPVLDVRLQKLMVALKSLARAPATDLALVGLTSTVDTLDPMIRYLGPFVTVCNDWNYLWTYLAGDIDQPTNFGYAQRALFNQAQPLQPNNVGTEGASSFVDGGGQPYEPIFGGDEYLHAQAYGAAVTNSGLADCETGQRGYVRRLNYYDPRHRDLALDPHTPVDLGPTFSGLARVPKGETFSREPQTGPRLPPVPGDN
jgi:virulence factor Mce-like protein